MIREESPTDQKSDVLVYKLPVLLSGPLGAVLIPIFKGRVRKKRRDSRTRNGGSDDKEQLNRLRIFSLAK